MPLSRRPVSENTPNENSNSPATSTQNFSNQVNHILSRYTFDSKRTSSPIQTYSNNDKENTMNPNTSGNAQKEPLRYTKRQQLANAPRRKTLPPLELDCTHVSWKEGKFSEQNTESPLFWNTRSSPSFSVYEDEEAEETHHKIKSQSSRRASSQGKQQESKRNESPKKSIVAMARKITERKSTSAYTILTPTGTLSTQPINKKLSSEPSKPSPKSSSKLSSKSPSSQSSPRTHLDKSPKSSVSPPNLTFRSLSKVSPKSTPKSSPKASPISSPRLSPKSTQQESANKSEECTHKQDVKEGIKKEKKSLKTKEHFIPYMPLQTESGIANKRDEAPKYDPRGSLHKYANTLPLTNIKSIRNKHHEDDTWDNLFGIASIRCLPNDLLLLIFDYCKDTETLYTISQVCQHWRRLSLEPSLWRDVSYQLSEFTEKLRILRDSKRLFQLNNLKRTIPLIKKMTIKAAVHRDELLVNSQFQSIDISPFTQLQHLHLIDVDLVDIYFIVRKLAPHISILDCENVQVSHMYGDFSMPDFSSMSNLKSLKLQFARRSGFGGVASTFDLATRRVLGYSKNHILPSSLEQLEISNVYNREEYLFRPQDATRSIVNRLVLEGNGHSFLMQELVQEWNNLEGLLLAKYNMLINLNNLTSLSLDRVNAFTARVWRECLIPCASQLEYLSLSGWTVSTTESPLDIMARARRLTATDKQQEKMEVVELALSDFISSLSNVKQITLNQFICGKGLVLGIEQLTQDPKRLYCCIVDDQQTLHLIGDYLDLRLYNFKISIK